MPLIVAAAACEAFGSSPESSPAPDGGGVDASATDGSVPDGGAHEEGGSQPCNRSYREDFEQVDASSFEEGPVNGLKLGPSQTGTFDVTFVDAAGSRVARFAAPRGVTSPSLERVVQRPCTTRLRFRMTANVDLGDSGSVHVLDAIVNRGGVADKNGLALLVTSRGVQLEGAGAFKSIETSTSGWHDVVIVFNTDSTFHLAFDDAGLTEGTKTPNSVATPLESVSIGILRVVDASSAADLGIDDLRID